LLGAGVRRPTDITKHLVIRTFFAGVALMAGAAPAAQATSNSKDFRSELRALKPAPPGVSLRVVGRDRFLELSDSGGRTVLVKGYDNEPYLRFRPDRVVEVNTRSPSKYVNEDRYGLRPVPPSANSHAPPKWKAVSRDGAYTWFDHRIHYMSRDIPEQVKDPDKRTKVFDWRVPITVDGRPVAAVGTLYWDRSSGEGGSNTAVIVAIVCGAAALLVLLAVLGLRRRRRPAAADEREPKEAW
jgi:MYXO-CTERM domain-containing protein